jgi:hypothetical protein
MGNNGYPGLIVILGRSCSSVNALSVIFPMKIFGMNGSGDTMTSGSVTSKFLASETF